MKSSQSFESSLSPAKKTNKRFSFISLERTNILDKLKAFIEWSSEKREIKIANEKK
ncbi:hypothetical protein HY448_01740 [Candidatus Pacearchaeota archaeon]|nr:hypothetical protein [Candidatus Pacearchaeota archaeon]